MAQAKRHTNRQIATILGQALGINIFSHEYEIITFLHENGQSAHKEILFGISCSSATIQRKLNYLRDKWLIDCKINSLDRRQHRFNLNQFTRSTLEEELSYFRQWDKNSPLCHEIIHQKIVNIEMKLAIKIFSNQYKVAITIYSNSGIKAADVFSGLKISRSKFYKLTQDMKAASLIISRPDADDKRVARYYLPDDVRSAIDSAHEELSSWTGTFGND